MKQKVYISPNKPIYLSYDGGGGSRIIKELYLADKDNVLIPFEGTTNAKLCFKQRMYVCFVLALSSVLFIRTYIQTMKYAKRQTIARKKNIVICDDLLMGFAFKKYGWRVILTYHGVGNPIHELTKNRAKKKLAFFINWVCRNIWRCGDIVVFPSEGGLIAYLESINGRYISKIINVSMIVPNGILDILPLLERAGIIVPKIMTLAGTELKSYNNSILCVSRLVSDKGVDLLVAGFHLLAKKNENVNLIIIGTGEEKTRILQYIRENKLELRIVLIDYLAREVVLTLMKLCRFFCVTPRRTVCDLVFLEALALGKFIVTTNIPGNIAMFGDKDVAAMCCFIPLDICRALEVGMSSAIWNEKSRNLYLSKYTSKAMWERYLVLINVL